MKTKITYRTLYYCVYPKECRGWTPDREFTGPTAHARLVKYIEKNIREGGEKLKVIRLIEDELTDDDLNLLKFVRALETVDASDPRLA